MLFEEPWVSVAGIKRPPSTIDLRRVYLSGQSVVLDEATG